jgi:hypothetical protein
LKALSLNGDENFDLIVLAYPVWFLAPAPPMVAFLKDDRAKSLLAGKPIITVISCRNMWLMAQEKMKILIAAAGGKLIDNVVLCDAVSTLLSFITTPLWLLTGNKKPFRTLPEAGIDSESILRCKRFGQAIKTALLQDKERLGLPLLADLQAVKVNPNLLISERAGTRSFFLWGKLLRRFGKPGAIQRIPLLLGYVTFLILLIVSVVPLSLLLQRIFRPLLRHRLEQVKADLELPSGSGCKRMNDYVA